MPDLRRERALRWHDGGSATAWGDSRPQAFDKAHPATGDCNGCHTTSPTFATNQTGSTAKPANHIPTNAPCAQCHAYGLRFYNMAAPTLKQPTAGATGHIPAVPPNGTSTIACELCHSPSNFTTFSGTIMKPAKVDHSTFTTACARCHNNLGAVGMPTGHLSTRIECGTCHSYPDWSALHFRHVSAAYPGNHRAALSCSSCHSSNTDQIPWRSPANAGRCAGCHAADFKPAAHPKTVKGQSYTVNELANCSGACHIYSDSTQSTITRSPPGPYHRVSDAAFKR